MNRSISGRIWAVLVMTGLSACGGTVTVSPGKGTPSDQLQSNGPERCKAACVTITTCGLGSQSCACSCPACAADAPGCECPPCECTQEASSPEKCESDCNDSLQQTLKDKPECDSPMLALLNCLAAAQCQSSPDICKAEQDAMKSCTESHSSPPPVGGADPGPSSGSSGSSGGSVGGAPGSSGTGSAGAIGAGQGGGVTCMVAGASLSPGSSGGSLPPPGTILCENDWDGCTDGQSYGVHCEATTSAVMTCHCVVDGTAQQNFPATSCVDNPAQASAACGWNLR